MSDGITPAQQLDLVLAARNAVLKQDGQDALGFAYLMPATAPRKFEMLGPLLSGRKQMRQGGPALDWYMVYKEYGSFQFVLPGQTRQPGIENVVAKGTAPWRHSSWDYSILRNELMGCRGNKEKLMDMFRARRASAYMDAALGMENEFWASPDYSSATQPLTMPYWIVPILGVQGGDTGTVTTVNRNGAFQGCLPNNDSTNWSSGVGGVDPGGLYTDGTGFASETYARHRNWNFNWSNASGQFTDVDADNLGNAFDAVDFTPPKIVTDLDKAPYSMQRIYVCQVLKNAMERAATQQNDNIGPDLAKYQNATMFRGIPLTWQRQLDTADTTYRGTYPIYGVNWAHGHIVTREGEEFLEQTFGPDKYLPDMTTTEVDLTYQLVATDRQKFGFVGSYAAES